jgi:hypothetical protein
MKILLPLQTQYRRAVLIVVVTVFVVSTNVSLSKSAGMSEGRRGPTPTLEPPRDPGPIPTIGGGTVTIEPGPTVIVTRSGVMGALATPAADTSEARRRATPTLEPPRDPGPIPTIGGGTVTIEPGPTVIVTRSGILTTPPAPMLGN